MQFYFNLLTFFENPRFHETSTVLNYYTFLGIYPFFQQFFTLRASFFHSIQPYPAWQRFLRISLSDEKEKRNLFQVVFIFLSSMRELTPSNAKWSWYFSVHTLGRMLMNADEWWTRPGRGFYFHSRQRRKNKQASAKQLGYTTIVFPFKLIFRNICEDALFKV